jgi:RES domain-containing protein
VIVWRLAKAAFAGLDGEGARLYGGRWNTAGRRMLYTSASPSLAVLEVMVHLDLPAELLPDDFRLLEIELPDDAPMERLDEAPLEAAAASAIGDDFLARGEALVLSVPSVVVPVERNALVNVAHPAMLRARLVADTPFAFDPRLLR